MLKLAPIVISLFLLLACSAEVSVEKGATAPLAVEKTVVCSDKPSSQKEGLCAKPLGSVVQGEFFVAALAQNAFCSEKRLVGSCDIVLTDSAGDILYKTEVPLNNKIESCLIPPKNRNFLCHVGLNANQLGSGNYTAKFKFQDSSGSTVEENVKFSVE